MENIGIRIFCMTFICFIFVAGIMPYIKKLAMKIGAVDIPRNKHIHKKPMPKLGGIAIFFGFLLGYMLFGTPSSIMNAVLIGSFIIILIGVLDDISELGPLPQFIGQFVAASIIVFYGDLLLKDISAFGFYLDFGLLSYPITILFIMGCINCINFIDGLDGLSGGISAIYFLTIGIIATLQGKTGLDFVLAFIMFGSTLGFLAHNFPPASIFAGQCGSMFMGFIISVIALLGFKNVTMTSLIIPLLILAIPILDTLFAIIRRSIKKQPIYMPDKAHLHHQLLNLGLSHRNTVLAIYAMNILFAFASIIYAINDKVLGICIYIILFILIAIIITKTSIIADKKENSKEKN